LFPTCSPEDYATLKKSIEVNGLLEPIVLLDGKILDGRHRYEICQELGIEPETVIFDGRFPLTYVIAKNLARRHLNESQRATLAVKIRQLLGTFEAGDTDSTLAGKDETVKGQICPFTIEEGAKTFNVSERQIKEAKLLQRKGTPEVIEQVEKGEKTIHAALKEVWQPVPVKDGKTRPLKYKPRKKTVAKASEAENGRNITVKLDRFDAVTVNFPLPEDYIEASQYVMEAFGVTDNPDRLKDIAKDLVAFGKELQEFAAWLDRIFD
jgi:hypothetical protein